MFVGQNEIINLQVGPELTDFIAPHDTVIFPMAFTLTPEQGRSLLRHPELSVGQVRLPWHASRNVSGDDWVELSLHRDTGSFFVPRERGQPPTVPVRVVMSKGP